MPRYGALAFTRRQLLKLTGQGAVRPFLGQREYRDLEAAAARIIPTDTLPGATEAHVVP